MKKKHIVVLDVIGLTPERLNDPELTPQIQKIVKKGLVTKIKPVFPAVTGSMQATYLTGKLPSDHGIICNGIPDRINQSITMWNQTMVPIQGEKIWEALKRKDPKAKTAVLFWQFSKLSTADIVVTPAPIHLENETIDWWCDSKPRGLYESLMEKQGPFDLKTFWGPLSSIKSSEWIAKAALDVLEMHRPRLSLVYLPNMDYHAQKSGPESKGSRQSVKEIDALIGRFVDDLEKRGLKDDTCLVLLSEYAFKPVQRPIFINQLLRNEGYVAVKEVAEREFLDLEMSEAFALADHQVAHVYIKNPDNISSIKKKLEATPGVQMVWGEEEKQAHHINHDRSGDLVVVAEPDSWFAYYWWLDETKAPPFARSVDIHRKPGYDPVELFVEPGTFNISLDASLIHGSHGRPFEGEDDWVSMVVSDGDVELPESIDATDVHDWLLNLALQVKE